MITNTFAGVGYPNPHGAHIAPGGDDWLGARSAPPRSPGSPELSEGHTEDLCEEGIDTRVLMRDRSPAEDILDVASAEDIDLIVMSTHGRSGLGRWAFGSVAEKVARHSPCPVLLVRGE